MTPIRIPNSKDTTGNGGNPRDTYLPLCVERDLYRYHVREDIAPDEPLVDLTERREHAIIKECANTAAATGDDDGRYVSSHDLRRQFAQRRLVDQQMNPRDGMAGGGWDSFQAIESFLNALLP